MAQGTTKRELREALAALEASCENSNLRCPGCGATHIPYQECSYCLSRMRARAILERPAIVVGYRVRAEGVTCSDFLASNYSNPRIYGVGLAGAERHAREVAEEIGGTVRKLVVR